MVGDHILMSCNKMQMNYLKIIQCDFLDFCFRFRLSQLKCTYDKKLQTFTCFVSRKTCKIGNVSNTCSPLCIYCIIFYCILVNATPTWLVLIFMYYNLFFYICVYCCVLLDITALLELGTQAFHYI